MTVGLRGYWRLDEGSGTTTADSSSYGNTGSLSGTPLPTWTTGITGNAILLGKLGGFVNFPGSPSLNNLQSQGGMSVVAWIYPTSLSGSQAILYKGTWVLSLDGNGIFGFGDFCTSGQVGSYSPANTVPLNQWTQLVATWNGSTTSSAVVLYVNGSAAISAYPSGCSGSVSSDSAYALTLGATYPNGAPLVGKIDDVRVYNRVLSATEVSTLYNMK